MAVPCRRLPLISTKVWLALRPRRRAESVKAAVSPPKDCALKDGIAWARAAIRSGLPARFSEAESTTWIGAALSTAFRPATRVPVTMTVSTSVVAGSAGVSAA